MLLKLFLFAFIVVLMIVFRRNVPFLMALCLFIFTNAFRGKPGSLLWTSKWMLYSGFILIGFLSNIQRFYKLKLIDLFFIFFMMIIINSYSISIEPALTLQKAISFALMYLAFFFGIYSLIDDIPKIFAVCKGMLIFLIVANLISIIPGIPKFGLRFLHGRFYGIYGPVGTSAINSFIYPIALMFYILTRKKIYLIAIFFIVLITYITFTRAAFIITIFSTLLFYSLYFQKTKVVFMIIALLLVLSVFISFFIFGIWLPEKLVRIENLPILGGRLEAWEAARNIISKRPLFGYGFGTEEILFKYHNITFFVHSGGNVHNSFLGLATQIGIPATVLFFTVIIFFTLSTIVYVSKITDLNIKCLGITLSIILFVGFVYCFAETWIYSSGSTLSFIYYTAAVMIMRLKSLMLEQGQAAAMPPACPI